jgi:hypothetical protein
LKPVTRSLVKLTKVGSACPHHEAPSASSRIFLKSSYGISPE